MSKDNFQATLEAVKEIRELTDTLTSISQTLQGSMAFDSEGRQLQNIVSLIHDELGGIRVAAAGMVIENELSKTKVFEKIGPM